MLADKSDDSDDSSVSAMEVVADCVLVPSKKNAVKLKATAKISDLVPKKVIPKVPEPIEEEMVVEKKRVSILEFPRAVFRGISLQAVTVKGLDIPAMAFELNKVCDAWGVGIKPSFMGVNEEDLLEPNTILVVLGWDKHGGTCTMPLAEYKRKRDEYYAQNPRTSSLGQFVTKMRDEQKVVVMYDLPANNTEACELVPRFKLGN